jgi:hypothetical protein
MTAAETGSVNSYPDSCTGPWKDLNQQSEIITAAFMKKAVRKGVEGTGKGVF